VLIADQASPPERRRHWPYVVAVTVGVLVGSLALSVLSQRILGFAVGPDNRVSGGAGEQFRAFYFRHATHAFVVFGLVTCVYVSHRWAAHRMRVLHAVQLDHAEMEKRLLESRLAAMQAQVEPGFLRWTLERIERQYETDARIADLMLRDLIVYLRAAIPRVRQPVSTVAQEIELVEAYLNTIGCAPGIRLMRREERSRTVDNARMPSMILLPLLNRARARHVDDGGERLAIDAAIRDDRLCLTIRDAGDAFANDGADDVELARIRERLAMLYGGRARLGLKATAGRSEAVLEIPYEDAQQA
jgi:LytS/YehU family sensor histidine kinase